MSLVENFRASSTRRQLLAVTVGVIVLGAMLVAGYFVVLRKPYDVLFTDLRTMDAATIVADLDKRRVSYRLADGVATTGWSAAPFRLRWLQQVSHRSDRLSRSTMRARCAKR